MSEQKEFELRRCGEALEAAQAELARNKDEYQRNQGENAQLRRQFDRQNEDKVNLQRQREGEGNRNRDLNAQLYELDARIRNKEEALQQSKKELDDVRFSNSSMLDRNQDVKAEIDALKMHINVLEGQNRDLNVELEKFVETDEQIRYTLNRRDRVHGGKTC